VGGAGRQMWQWQEINATVSSERSLTKRKTVAVTMRSKVLMTDSSDGEDQDDDHREQQLDDDD